MMLEEMLISNTYISCIEFDCLDSKQERAHVPHCFDVEDLKFLGHGQMT
jgi:hypothetical protein